MRQADWFFDYISPYSYLQFHQIRTLPADVEVTLRPVLIAGLLNAWGQLGPAEIPAKKTHSFLLCKWRARARGLPFTPPPRHPFNPLALLRLTLALGSTPAVVGTIFDHIWAKGRDGQDPTDLEALATDLGVDDLAAAIGAPAVKDQLRQNTEEAVAAGVYGVPSFVIENRLFWGDDMLEMMCAWLDDPTLLDNPEVHRISDLPSATAERER